VHNQTVTQAIADHAVIASEEATGGRFQRFQAWWSNAREHFVEWRDYFQDRVESYRSRWTERVETPESSSALSAAEPTPPEPQGPEL
jgi:hypothetical protein